MTNWVCLAIGGCPTLGAMLDGIEFFRKRRQRRKVGATQPEPIPDRELAPLAVQPLPRLAI